MNRLLDLLLRFLTLGVGPGEEEDDDLGGEAAVELDDKGSTGDDSFDDLLELAEDSGGKPKVDEDETPAVKEARRREKEARDDADRERQGRIAAESRAAPQRGPDPQWEAEDRELAQLRASGADASAVSWKEWQIQSNRNIRASNQASQSALLQSQDIADRTAFERLEITKPKVYKAYADRVEMAMAEMRSRGQNAPRLAVLRLLIGDDIMNGKVKPKTAKREAEKPAGVDRGRAPGVRSDVRARGNGKLTKGQEAAKRLEGRLI